MHSKNTWVEIDTQQLASNITTIRHLLPKNTALAFVVKGNAYGHDMQLVSSYCEQNKLVDFFCVAYLSEALQLRKHGITLPILVLCFLDESIEEAIKHEIDITVSNLTILEAVEKAAQRLQKKAHVHIKVDTGLSRFGFLPHEIPQLITALHGSQHMIIRGLYSHFAQSEQTDRSYTEQQTTTFTSIVNHFFASNIRPPYIHQQNSAGILTQPDSIYTMARIGALAYGIWSSDFQKKLFEHTAKKAAIKPILSFKTHIIDIKTVAPNTRIGYGGSFVTSRTTKIAIIPVGYADGYIRNYGRQNQPALVYIHGKHVRVIGHIAMNATTIDVTDLVKVEVDDTVTLIGPYPSTTPNDLAQLLDTRNPREVTISIDSCIPRIAV